MTKIRAFPKKLLGLFFASKQFWLCNIIGWFTFNLVQSLRDSFEGNSLFFNLIKHIPTTILGILAGLCVHFLYKKLQWYKRHPIQLIPIAAVIALVFAGINIFINLFDQVIALPEVCARQYSHTPNSCGMVSNLFIQTMEAMLVWCLLYFLIQAERKTQWHTRMSTGDVIKAIITLLSLHYLDNLISVIAYIEWGNTHYLFSQAYFLNLTSNIVFTVFFASYALFIKSRESLFESQILSLIPALCAISFCCTVLTIGANSAILRTYYSYVNGYALSDIQIYYILFGQTYGIFNSKGQLAGTLQGGFANNLIMALFFISCRNSDYRKIKPRLATNIDVKKLLYFWSYNFFFWLSFGLVIYAVDLMDLTTLGRSVPLISTISFVGIGIFMGAALDAQIHYFAATKTAPIALVLKIFFASVFMGILLTSTIWLINYTYIFVILDGYEIEKYTNFVTNNNYVFASILASCVLCGLWSFICYMIESQNLQRDAAIKQLQIENNMKEIQLNTLAGKIDPHFVFNTLNNIRALVDEDSEKARSALVVLSDILRSPITKNLQNKIPLAEELQLVRNYICLSKIQLEERLVYKEEINENLNTALIPSMMLQILVENAIKHGISQLPDGGVLSLQVRKCEQQLVCTIINQGALLSNATTSGFGVGIKAVRERLTLLYSANASFSLQAIDNNVVAELILPLEISI